MKFPRILFSSLLCLLFLSISNQATAREFTVNSDFIKMLVLVNGNGGPSRWDFICEQLARLDHKNLKIIRDKLKADIDSNKGEYVIPLPVEQSLTYQIIYKIDDMLGELKYDKILIGKFDNIISSKNYSADLFDRSNNILEKDIIIPVELTKPYSEYFINNKDIVKLYLVKYKNINKYYTIKIEIVEYQ